MITLVAVACASEAPAERSEDALATSLTPQFPAEYYVEQTHHCFDTLDTSANPESILSYSKSDPTDVGANGASKDRLRCDSVARRTVGGLA